MIKWQAYFITSLCLAVAFGEILNGQNNENLKGILFTMYGALLLFTHPYFFTENRIDFSFDGSDYVVGPFEVCSILMKNAEKYSFINHIFFRKIGREQNTIASIVEWS